MAVMRMVAMRPRVHSLKIEKIVFGVNYGFFLALVRAPRAHADRPRNLGSAGYAVVGDWRFELFWHCRLSG
jgi:hypothetical protein